VFLLTWIYKVETLLFNVGSSFTWYPKHNIEHISSTGVQVGFYSIFFDAFLAGHLDT